MSPEGGVQEHLLTGVAGPDADLHPQQAQRARLALDQLIAGASLSVTPAGAPDRYGRTPVTARLASGEDLAVRLIESGWAIVWPRDGQTADFDSLFAAEIRARDARTGGWNDGVFHVFAPAPNTLAQRLDSAVIVEGRIVSSGEGRNGRLYLNFGLDWRSDFTLSADRDARERFRSQGVALESLEGAIIRVRGWLYAENGPMIALTHPAQIEIIDAPQAAGRP